jgi:hypothetical protein
MIKLFNPFIGLPSPRKTKSFIHASLIVATLAALLAFVVEAGGKSAVPTSDPFVILLQGIYEPVVHGPNLGLDLVDLDDGSYSKTKIYRVEGLPGGTQQAVGTFYVQAFRDVAGSGLCVYDVPGGKFTAVFTEVILIPEDDGTGLGVNLVGTAELDILEATGIYKSFVGGHIHMVDILHLTFEGNVFNEYCFCHISR